MLQPKRIAVSAEGDRADVDGIHDDDPRLRRLERVAEALPHTDLVITSESLQADSEHVGPELRDPLGVLGERRSKSDRRRRDDVSHPRAQSPPLPSPPL